MVAEKQGGERGAESDGGGGGKLSCWALSAGARVKCVSSNSSENIGGYGSHAASGAEEEVGAGSEPAREIACGTHVKSSVDAKRSWSTDMTAVGADTGVRCGDGAE